MTTDSSLRTDTGGIFTGTRVDDSIKEDLDGVLVGEQEDDFKSVLDDTSGHQLLSVVSSVHHQRVGQTLDNRAEGLAKTLDLVTTGSVGNIDVGLDVQVVVQGEIFDFEVVV